MKKKVFCKFCKHHGLTVNGVVSRECYHSKNLIDSWFDRKNDTIAPASYINGANDCKWFEFEGVGK